MARARTLWEEGTWPGRRVVRLGVAGTLGIVGLDLAVNRDVTLVFDIAFVLLCVVLALLVRPADFFTVGVLPPLLMLGSFWLVGLFEPDFLAHAEDGAFIASLTGLADHSEALVVGYALCLACLSIRRSVTQASKRSGSPAPRRMTSGAPSE